MIKSKTPKKTPKRKLGFNHSKETRAKQAIANKGEMNPMYGKKVVHSEETRARLSVAKKRKNNPMYGKAKPEGSGRLPQRLSVLDLTTNEKTSYDSISAAAKVLGIRPSIITTYFNKNQKKPYKKRYIFQKI